MTTKTVTGNASVPSKRGRVATKSLTGEISKTAIKYVTDKEIYTALDALVPQERSFRAELQAVLVSAISHHETCKNKGGSVGTVLTKVWSAIEDMRAAPKAQLSRYLSAVFPKLTWSRREKKFEGKHTFRNVIKPRNGRAQHYSGINFWDYAPQANRSTFNVEDRIEALIKALQRAVNSETQPLEGESLAKARLAIDALDVIKEGKTDKGFAQAVSMAHAGKQIELKANPTAH